MARHLYSIVFYISLPLILLRLLWRSFKAPAYRQGIGERFGFYKGTPQPSTLWIHCVSVGETLAAAPLIEALLAQQPQHPLLITSTTPTGAAQVQRLFGERVAHCYAPYDLPDCVARFLNRVKPVMALVIETEVWPNMMSLCQQRNIPTALINARMSLKSHEGYRKIRALSYPMFASIKLISAQSEADKQRLQALGASHITVTGSIKNDFVISDTMRKQALSEKAHWQQQRGQTPFCIIAASTHEGEDSIILDAFRSVHQQYPNTLLILAPRHPERFESVYTLSERAGFSVAKRTDGRFDKNTQVLLANTMGELPMLLGTADIAIMGGTFIDNGGHNFLEPAAWAVPMLSGDSTFNFAAISAALIEKEALIKVESKQSLTNNIIQLIEHAPLREQRGQAALDYFNNNRGAVERNLQQLKHLLRN